MEMPSVHQRRNAAGRIGKSPILDGICLVQWGCAGFVYVCAAPVRRRVRGDIGMNSPKLL